MPNESWTESIAKSWATARQESAGKEGSSTPQGPWLTEYQGSEFDFIRDVLGAKGRVTGQISAWEFQRDYMRGFFDGHDSVCGSARLSGKSKMLAGFIAPTLLATRPCRIIMLSTGMDQVRDTLMSEFAQSYRSETHTLPGRLGATRLDIDKAHYMTALPTKNPDRARGYHGGVTMADDPDADEITEEELEMIADDPSMRGVPLYLMADESQNIGAEYFRVLQGIRKGRTVTMSMTGNTTLGVDDDHDYVRALHPSSSWRRYRVSTCSAETEAELGIPPDPWMDGYHGFYRIPHLLSSLESFQEACTQLDPMDAIFWSDWLGRFLVGATTRNVVPRAALEAALAWEAQGLIRPRVGPRIGIDVSLGGGDKCVASIFNNQKKVGQEVWTPGDDSPKSQVATAIKIAQVSVKWGKRIHDEAPADWPEPIPITGNRISIDDTGGNGVADILGEKGIELDRVNFAAKAQGHHRALTGSQRFLNVRAEMYWCARRLLQTGNALIGEEFSESWQQLPWTEFEAKPDKLGSVIQLEPKDDVKARKGCSPDFADSDVLALRETTTRVHAGQAGPPTLSGVVIDTPGGLNRRRKRRRFH